MALSQLAYIYSGTNQFPLNFALGYLDRAHVTARVNEEVDGGGNPSYRTLTFINDAMVSIDGVLNIGDKITISRTTPKTILWHDYENGAILIEENLDESNLQNIMIAHEALDGRLNTLTNNINMGNNKIVNLADGTDPQDAVNKRQLDALLPDVEAARDAAIVAQGLAEDARDAALAVVNQLDGVADAAISEIEAATQSELASIEAASQAELASIEAASQGYLADAQALLDSTEAAGNTALAAINTASSTYLATAQTLLDSTEAASAAALLAADEFGDLYLGSKSSAPSLDNDGDPLQIGALYYDTTLNAIRYYNGSTWNSIVNDFTNLQVDTISEATSGAGVAIENININNNVLSSDGDLSLNPVEDVLINGNPVWHTGNFIVERGLWTPELTTSNNDLTVNYFRQYGDYTRYGDTVTITGRIVLDFFSGGTGHFRIIGVPYAFRATSGSAFDVQVGYYSNLTLNGFTTLTAMGFSTETQIRLSLKNSITTVYANNTNLALTNSTAMQFTCTYIIS